MKQLQLDPDVSVENLPLTSEEKYGKTYSSRVSGNDTDVSREKAIEKFELPLVSHEGRCFVHLERGEAVSTCPCLDALDIRHFEVT